EWKFFRSLTIIHLFRIHVMVHHPMVGHRFKFGTFSAIIAVWIDADSTPWGEFSPHLYVFRIHKPNQVLHDDIDAIFVEVAVIPEAEKIEFQAFAFHHQITRYIADVDSGKIRLTGNWTKRGEFGHIEFY